MLTPDNTHPQQADSSAKPIDTRSTSLDGLVVAVKGRKEQASPSMAGSNVNSTAFVSNPLLFVLPGLELLLLLLVLLLHITHSTRLAQQPFTGGAVNEPSVCE